MSVREKVLGAESRWLMGRVMAGDFLEGGGKYLHLVAPDREKELSAAEKQASVTEFNLALGLVVATVSGICVVAVCTLVLAFIASPMPRRSKTPVT